MQEAVVMAVVVVATIYIMIPKAWRRRIAGYVPLFDILGSAYVVSTYVATGTVSGLAVGVWAALGITLTLRAMRRLLGAERLAVRGETRLAPTIAGLITQGLRWGKSIFTSLWHRDPVVIAPPPLDWEWVEVQPAMTLRSVNKALVIAR